MHDKFVRICSGMIREIRYMEGVLPDLNRTQPMLSEVLICCTQKKCYYTCKALICLFGAN